MSRIRLKLPGRLQTAPSTVGVGRAAGLIDAVVRTECDVGAARRDGRADEGVLTDADENDVVQLQWEGGIVELVRVGDLQQTFGMAVRSGADELTVPQFRSLKSPLRGAPAALALESVQHIAVDSGGLEPVAEGTVTSGDAPKRGDALTDLLTGGLTGKVAQKVAEKVTEYALPPAIRKIEAQRIPRPGVYFLNVDGTLGEQATKGALGPGPHLLLVHGTFSNTATAFKDLFASEEWNQLYGRYSGGSRVLALEHRTISESPARNAKQLVDGLPAGSRLHLLTHSRGGLIGDLLCRGPWSAEDVHSEFAGDAFESVRRDLIELGQALFSEDGARATRVERFLRVAAPAAGTQLAGRRLDQFFSIGLTLLGKLIDTGVGWFDFLKAIAVQIVAARTRADACPGLEAMMPDSAFIRFLNLASVEGVSQELAVISGDVQGGNWFQLLKEVFADFYFRKRANDFIVDTASMKRGVQRTRALHYHREGADADHFSYFRDREVRGRLLSYLGEGSRDGFLELDRGTETIPARSRLWLGDTTLKLAKRPELPTVFLVPGIMGTRLADADGNVIWINPWRLSRGGLQGLIFNAANTVRPLKPIELAYERLARFLERDFNVELFGFDWRKSIQDSSAELANAMQEVLKTGATVHLVAHSMGGLVSRGLIAWHREVWKDFVNSGGRLLMLGTPNFGSFVPAQLLVGQSAMLNKIDFLDRASNIASLTEVVKEFPGLLEMLPRRASLGIDWLDYAKWEPFRDYRPNKERLEAARNVRDVLDATQSSKERMFYVAGRGKTPVKLDLSSSGAVFLANDEGDETVPWALGTLDGVPTYYVNATHGSLANHEDSFPGYLELLRHGRTGLLAAEPRSRSAATMREAAGQSKPLERLDPTPEPVLYFPSEQDILAGILGTEAAMDDQQEQELQLSVTNGHIHASRYPIVVGHYEGDPITSVEAVLDRRFDGQLSRDHALRIYPGRIGSMRWYKHRTGGGGRGVIVVGLGQAGSLTRARLTETLREGLLRYAADRYQLDPQGSPLDLRIASLLIGSWGKLTVEDSVSAVIGAVRECNQRLLADPSRQVKYVAVEFIELYRDLATQAAHALQRLQEGEKTLIVRAHVKTLGTFRRNRPASHSGYYDRVAVLAKEGIEPPFGTQFATEANVADGPPTLPAPPPPGPPRPEFIKYEVVTGLARSDLRERCIQWSHVEKLLRQAPSGDKGAVDTLFQYLLPFELKNQARDAADLVLQLDEWTAQIPWELMSPEEGESDRLVRRAILRTLQIDRPRLRQPTTSARALVIGEPAGVSPALPGARTEGDQVARLLSSAGLLPRILLGADADDNFRALLEEPYDIVHIAAHGHYDANNPRHSGVVLSNGRFLTACEFENLKATPSIVFLNCCHLGRMRLRQPGAWSAGVAEELIRIGVAVVVVAGWAVSDHAAVVFAKTLYGELLHGQTLMNAVRVARERTRDATSGTDVTWGAYQVYGDPGFTMPNRALSRSDGTKSGGAPTWVSPHELVEQVLDLEVRAGEDSEKSGGRLDTEVTRIWNQTPDDWKERGDVNAAFGRVYGALGNFKRAIDHCVEAIRWSDAETRAIEQLANYEAREAVRLLERDGAASSNQVVTEAAGYFSDSLRRLDCLLTLGDSAERHALRAATLRRIARCRTQLGDHAPMPPDTDYVKEALASYVKAADAGGERRYYPLLQVQGMTLCLEPSKVTAEALQTARNAARVASDEGDAFADVVLVELDIIQDIAKRSETLDQSLVTRRARELLEALDASGVAQERRDSLFNNWQTLAALAIDPRVQAWLNALLQALGVAR